MNPKIIVAQLVPEEGIYKRALCVVFSTHPRFITGTRFDWGFANISMNEGYSLTLLPLTQDAEPEANK